MRLKKTISHQPAEPLWQRAPTRTETGELAADFMMLISGFKSMEFAQQQNIYQKLYQVLKGYDNLILLAEVNMQMSTLWVSHKPRPGLGAEIASMIHFQIPQAKLISQQFA